MDIWNRLEARKKVYDQQKKRIKSNSEFKYLILISTIIVTLYIVTAVVQNRLVSFFHFNVCAAIFVYPFSYIFSDICTEIYGYKISRQVLWCALLSWVISGFFISFIIHLPTPAYWTTYSEQFNVVMGPYLRTILSGIIAVIAGQFINIYTISKFKILTRGKYFWLRSVSSCFVGDLITTVSAISFIFFGRIPLEEMLQIIFYELIISIVLQAIFAFPLTAIVYFLKKSENVDVFDYNVNFNPFKFSTDEELRSNKQ